MNSLRRRNFRNSPKSGAFRPSENAELGSFAFCETPYDELRNSLRLKISIFLTLAFGATICHAETGTFHKKKLESAMQAQPFLIPPEALPPRVRYGQLFSLLPLPAEPAPQRGRRPVSRNALVKALVYRALRRLHTLGDLVFELNNNHSVATALGFSPTGRMPSVERFSSFLRKTPNEYLQQIRRRLVAELLAEGVIAAKVLTLDSCPIPVQVKENNPKVMLRHNRFDKTSPPRGDPEAGVGVTIHCPSRGKKEVNFFWGYRNHVLGDAVTELPLEEATHPANVHELTVGRKLLHWARRTFGESTEAVAADAEFDSEDILEFILNTLKAEPVIPHNPRREQPTTHTIRKGKVYCLADLEMVHRGKMTVKSTGITYRQYSCPLHWRKRDAKQFLFCPAQHPKYFEQEGCNVLIRLTPTVRSQIPYGSSTFIETYNKRTSVERIFSRLLAIAAQKPTVRGVTAVSNHVTIAHITVLLVAKAAHASGHPDKLRFVRSFVPGFLT